MYKLIFLFLFLNISSLVQLEQLEKTSCYVNRGGQNWKLVYEDQFEEGKLSKNWVAEHEKDGCHGNYIRQVSCNVARNAYLNGGYLILAAHPQMHQNLNYTSATVTSTTSFTYGRLEIRLSQPVGSHLRTSIFTKNDNDTYWHQHGQIDLMTINQNKFELSRGVHFANSTNQYQGEGLALRNTTDVHQFHVYGIEWTADELRFIFDEQISPPIQLSIEKNLDAYQKLRLQIGVGGQFFNPPEPMEADVHGWTCPAMIVDYVKFYEKVEDVGGLEMCEEMKKMKKKENLEQICAEVLKSGAGKEVLQQKLTNYAVILVVVFVMLYNCASF